MVNRIFFFSALCLSLASCVHQETQTTDVTLHVKGIHIDMPDFFKVTAEDLRKLELGMRKGSKAGEIVLSGDRHASCQTGVCKVRLGEGLDMDLKRSDLRFFTQLQRRSQASGREEKKVQGPVTLLCSAQVCSASFFLDDKGEHEISGKANVKTETDYSGFFLGSFIGGMVTGAISPHSH